MELLERADQSFQRVHCVLSSSQRSCILPGMIKPRLPGFTIVDHPLVKAKVTILRNKETPTELFRRTLHELTALLAFEATRDLEVVEIDVETPLERCKGHRLSKGLTVVPILRAGLGMAEAMLDVLPQARLGHVGIYRDETTFEPMSYYFKAPLDLADSDVFLVDPDAGHWQQRRGRGGQVEGWGCRAPSAHRVARLCSGSPAFQTTAP